MKPNRYYLLAEYCAAYVYTGWWLYCRRRNDGRPNEGWDRWGWLRDGGPTSKQAEVRILVASLGYTPPALARNSQAFAEWFAATFPAGLIVTIDEYGCYTNARRVRRLPGQRRRGAIRTIQGAKRADSRRGSQ